jgi:hypothetical protein
LQLNSQTKGTPDDENELWLEPDVFKVVIKVVFERDEILSCGTKYSMSWWISIVKGFLEGRYSDSLNL